MSLYIKLAALGALLLLSFLLNTVSVFTKGWLYWSLGTGLPGDSGSFGVVPYHKEIASVGVASVLMYLTFALFFIMFLIYAFAGFQIQRNGGSEGSHMTFFALSLISSHITLMSLIAVILIAVDTNQFKSLLVGAGGLSKLSVGYSAWLALASGLILIAVSVLSLVLAKTDND